MPDSEDRDGIERAPEVEHALVDGCAIEVELPFEKSHLETYKFADSEPVALRWITDLSMGTNHH